MWSLVIGAVVGVIAATLLLWIVTPWRPRALLLWSEIRGILGYSLNLSGYNVVSYFSRNADNLIVGKFLGATALGYYQIAYNLMLYSIQSISVVAGRVLFPALVRLRDDDARLRAAFTKGASIIAALVFPVMLGVASVANPFVRAVLGPRWLPVIPVLLILAPAGVMQCILITVGNVYTAKGRTALMFRWGIFSTAIYVSSFFAGLPWGINGVAGAYLIANALLFWPALWLPLRLIDLRIAVFLRSFWPVLASSITMAAVVWMVSGLVSAWDAVAQLAVLIAIGALAYSSVMLWWRPAAARDLLESIRRGG
jgi:PST family polysaccharide transporter